MVESRYFCDRCGAETTKVGAQFALYKVSIDIPSGNTIGRDVCSACIAEIRRTVEEARAQEKAE